MSSKRPDTEHSRKLAAPAKSPKIGENDRSGSDLCDLIIDVDLEGVRAEALRGLLPGEELRVRLDRAGALMSAVCVRKDGVIVGSLSSFRNITQLLNCLERGVEYVAIVSRATKGSCHVQGRRAAS
jgi:hypothetical protein